VSDYVWVVCRVHRCDVAGVEGVVPLLHELEEVCSRLVLMVMVDILGLLFLVGDTLVQASAFFPINGHCSSDLLVVQ
jgi:hypothetical protein